MMPVLLIKWTNSFYELQRKDLLVRSKDSLRVAITQNRLSNFT